MAQDVRLRKNDDGIYDINIIDGDFESVNGIETAIGVSLFTDSRATSINTQDSFRKGGWAGNILTIPDNFELGSELWTLDQARLDQNTLNEATDKTKKCLEWIIEDGIANNLDVDSVKIDERTMKITIKLYKDSNKIAEYITLWNNTKPFSG